MAPFDLFYLIFSCALDGFRLFVNLLDQVRSQDMVIISVLTIYHLDLFILPRASFAPSNHAIGPSGEKPDVAVIKPQASAAGWAFGTIFFVGWLLYKLRW